MAVSKYFVHVLFISGSALFAQHNPVRFRFDFGEGPPARGYEKVTPETTYTEQRGYGLEPEFSVAAVTRRPGVQNSGARSAEPDVRDDFLTSPKPFLFSAAVPEGNYRVTVVLGDRNGDTQTTVKAELRRLMLENVRTTAGTFVDRQFIVNVRNPRISTGEEIHLKPREKTSETRAWDGKLTLEFNDFRPAVCSVEIEPAGPIPTVYIAGDSTSTDQPVEPFNSWGQMITRFFSPAIAVANHGESGESLRAFIGENRLAKVMSLIQPGDYLLIQMGHNDMKEKGDGIGAFTSYKSDLKRFVSEARRHGATPILITPMNRRTFDTAGHITNSLGDYPEAVRQAAREENVALIDLNAASKVLYEAIGVENSIKAFAPGDGTHHNNYGSYELAKCIVEAIRSQHLPLARFLLADTPPFDPAHPDSLADFRLPPSP